MLALTTVVAVAVSLGVVVIVFSVVGTLVWIRIRQEKLSMAMANARTGPYSQGLQGFPADTVTELSREEGTALGQYGQLPYGNPTEWALLESRERLLKPSANPELSSQSTKKARSLRHSLSRSKSKRGLRTPFSSPLPPLGETGDRSSLEKPPYESRPSKEDVEISAIEGIVELPAENSPRQTPEIQRSPNCSSADMNHHPMAGAWSVLTNRDHSSSLFPVREDEHEGFDPFRLRGSITTQSAGTVPDQPVPPPPPCAYPPNRFRMTRNDSSLRFSSLSLDTADSSILDDGRRTPMMIDSNFNSPALPPCPTFAPFDADDVGRSVSVKSSMHNTLAFPIGSLEWESHRLERDRTSPRRSLTARSTSYSTMERISPPPRRSESVSINSHRRDPRFASLGNAPVLYPSHNNIPAHWNGVNYNTALLPHFSQMQRPSTHSHRRKGSADSYLGSDKLVTIPEGPGRKGTSFYVHETPLSADGHPRAPPPSVLKGGHGPRKGHRRQNCVRISIHPPITFGGPVFSPMAEEPEEVEGQDRRKSELSQLSTTNISSFPSDSTISTDRPSSYRRASYRTASRKRQHAQIESGNVADTGPSKSLPGINTVLPTRQASLSRTPSPDKSPQVLTLPSHAPSPTTHENGPSPPGPRISAVKGPRSQPGKQARNPVQRLSIPLAENRAASPSTSPSGKPNSLARESQKSPSPLQQDNSSDTDRTFSTKDRNAGEGLEVISGPQPASRPLSPTSSAGVNKNPSTRSGNIVPIWEDTKLERVPTKGSSVSCPGEAIELQGDITFHNDNSNTRIERHKSTGGIKMDENNSSNINIAAAAKLSRTSTPVFGNKPERATPVKKTVGLGIGTAPSWSLYEGDGFLKE